MDQISARLLLFKGNRLDDEGILKAGFLVNLATFSQIKVLVQLLLPYYIVVA